VSLKNGCICCSLQGDLLRTLATLTRREPAPDAIVIETSGASDPAEIVRSLLDPVIFAVTPLDTVLSVVDARGVSDRPALLQDPLWRSQLGAADFAVIAKTDLVDPGELEAVRAIVRRWKPPSAIFEAIDGAVPSDLLFSRGDHAPAEGGRPGAMASAERFETMSWTADEPLSLARFQAAIGRLAPRLLRAKGFVTFDHRPDQPMLFQLVGTRATIVPTTQAASGSSRARLVLIAETGRLGRQEATALLDAAVETVSRERARPAVSTGRA
jgi:cobalamin biosynthesis protein CobW